MTARRSRRRPAAPQRGASTRWRPPTPTTSTGSSPRRSTSCARSRPVRATRRCCSPAARIRSCCCAWPRRRSVPAASRSRCCTSTPGTTFRKSSPSATARAAELGERLIVRSVEDSIARGPRRAEARPTKAATPHQSVTLLDAIAEFGFDACIGGARRDEEKARAKERVFSLPRRVRPVGPEEPASRAVEPLQRARPPGRARARVPDLQLDRARRLAVHRAREPRACRRSTSRTRGRSSAARGALVPVTALTPPRAGETRRGRLGALPHRRRHHLHRAGRVRRGHARRDHRRDRRRHASPSAAPRAWTTRPTKRRWNCARRRGISDDRASNPSTSSTTACCASSPPAASTTARAR